MGESAAMRTRRPVGRARCQLGAQVGQGDAEKIRLPGLAGCAPHGRLLFDFAVAAQQRQAGAASQALQDLPGLLQG